jgi:hypothetical protein
MYHYIFQSIRITSTSVFYQCCSLAVTIGSQLRNSSSHFDTTEGEVEVANLAIPT